MNDETTSTPSAPPIGPPRVELRPARSNEDFDRARAIFREYAKSLAVDLCFQDFEQELVAIEAVYGPPQGLLLMAFVDGQVAGCGAFRAIADVDHANACEMKRLYVRHTHRQLGLGRRLAEALIRAATEVGYSCMLLDTLDDMEAARDLYQSLGFEEIAPYYFNPIPGAHYLKVDLAKAASRL